MHSNITTYSISDHRGLGHLAIQYARAMGYRTVALSTSDAKKELAFKLGAHDYIDGSKVDQAQALQEMGGAKVIMCTAPSGKAIQKLLPGLGTGGQLVVLGISPEEATVTFGASHSVSARAWSVHVY